MESWAELVVDRLQALKLTGMAFEAAWTVAVREFPPRGRDRGSAVPLLFGEEESLVDFTRRVCRDAWLGEAPSLVHLPTALRDLGRDGVTPARGVSRLPSAA